MDWRKLDLDKRILATLAFFDIFDYPLNLADFEKYFLGGWCGDREKFKLHLEKFLNNGNLEKIDGYFCLNGRAQIVKIWYERQRFSEKLWKRVNWFRPLIRRVPFLKMVAVCNTLSFHNAAKDSDIDLFVVTADNRIFTVRYFLTILLGILGVRRHGKKIAGRFCLSFFVSESALDLHELKFDDDIYLPFWIKSLQPLAGFEIYDDFLKKNLWIENYFDQPICNELDGKVWGNGLVEFFLKGKIGNMIESFLRSYQLRQHAKKALLLGKEASVILNDQMLKFHNIDRRAYFADEFKKRLEQLQITLN